MRMAKSNQLGHSTHIFDSPSSPPLLALSSSNSSHHSSLSSLAAITQAKDMDTRKKHIRSSSCYRCGTSLPCSYLAQLQSGYAHGHCNGCLTYLFTQVSKDVTMNPPKCLCGGEIQVDVARGYVYWKLVDEYEKTYRMKFMKKGWMFQRGFKWMWYACDSEQKKL